MMTHQWSVLEETPHWLVINKPAGLNVEVLWDYPSVEKQVQEYLKQNSRRQDPYLGIVHRLDRPVSGALVLAKKKSSLRFLNQQFAERRVQKIYWAVCSGRPPATSGTLEHHLVKDQQQKRSFAFTEARKGSSPAKLSYRVIHSQDDQTWMEVRLHTGKYHQIRVQMAAIDCPIVGDQKYGSTLIDEKDCIALHARRLRFADPLEPTKLIHCEAPLPNRSVWQKG